jgi:hypothetical protein
MAEALGGGAGGAEETFHTPGTRPSNRMVKSLASPSSAKEKACILFPIPAKLQNVGPSFIHASFPGSCGNGNSKNGAPRPACTGSMIRMTGDDAWYPLATITAAPHVFV